MKKKSANMRLNELDDSEKKTDTYKFFFFLIIFDSGF
jgi:hypothetical protein